MSKNKIVMDDKKMTIHGVIQIQNSDVGATARVALDTPGTDFFVYFFYI